MARNISPEEYQELGRRYYKLKQFDKAVETFTSGIDACPTASLYDHRAATYEKLENFNAAVKDGRQMIRLDKKDVKGYLRTASVLEKMGKEETALGIYRYGMKNVPTSDKNYKVCNTTFICKDIYGHVLAFPSIIIAFLIRMTAADLLSAPSRTVRQAHSPTLTSDSRRSIHRLACGVG
jgi:tetratricopeptide (TPR) repeat protein